MYINALQWSERNATHAGRAPEGEDYHLPRRIVEDEHAVGAAGLVDFELRRSQPPFQVSDILLG